MKREEVIFNIYFILALAIYFSYLCFINSAIIAINIDFSVPFIEFVIALGFASIIINHQRKRIELMVAIKVNKYFDKKVS